MKGYSYQVCYYLKAIIINFSESALSLDTVLTSWFSILSRGQDQFIVRILLAFL